MANEQIIQKIEKFKKGFLRKLESENKSNHTLEAYERNINKFIEFLEQYNENIDFDSIVENDIFEYLDYRNEYSDINKTTKIKFMNKDFQISIATKNQIISTLKKFFSYIEKNSKKIYDFSKVFEDIKIKKPKREPKGLNELSYHKLINFLEEYKKMAKDFTNYRNTLLLKIMLFAGARVSEAISIKFEDIKQSPKDELYEIMVIGKGSKQRKIYIEKTLIDDEIDYLLKKIDLFNLHDLIAKTKTLKKMDRVQLYKAINIIYGLAGINETMIHSLRHTYAKEKAKKIPLSVLQKLLGHSDISITSIYTDPTEEIILDSLSKNI